MIQNKKIPNVPCEKHGPNSTSIIMEHSILSVNELTKTATKKSEVIEGMYCLLCVMELANLQNQPDWESFTMWCVAKVLKNSTLKNRPLMRE